VSEMQKELLIILPRFIAAPYQGAQNLFHFRAKVSSAKPKLRKKL